MTSVPLEFESCGSWFVVFRAPAAEHLPNGRGNSPVFTPCAELPGAWQVRFDPKWGGPGTVEFAALASWPERSEPGIKFYSGTATYTKTFDRPPVRKEATAGRFFLNLGRVREVAEVRLNGKSCGIVWAPPFRVEVTDALKPGENQIEIDVVNFWPNRIIGDANLPPERRLTRTNILELKTDTALMPSGLLGSVQLEVMQTL